MRGWRSCRQSGHGQWWEAKGPRPLVPAVLDVDTLSKQAYWTCGDLCVCTCTCTFSYCLLFAGKLPSKVCTPLCVFVSAWLETEQLNPHSLPPIHLFAPFLRSHLPACQPGICNFLLTSSLTMVVRSQEKVASPNNHGIQLTMATETAGIVLIKRCSHYL